jgi:hypothetical protein
MLAVVPEGDEVIENSPPCSVIIRFTIANPKPVPDGFVEQNGVVSLGKISGGIGLPPLWIST